MSNTNNAGFGNMIPGFDFLKNLASQNTNINSGNPMAAVSQWIAPTLSVEDINKRIEELKSVQFWLEQNLMGLKATIQALEVQKMTISTLESMNFSMADMAKAFTPKMPTDSDSSANKESTSYYDFQSATKKDAPKEEPASPTENSEATGEENKSIVDPMAWWNGITEQFGQIASATLKDIQEQSEKAAALAQEQALAQAQALADVANAAAASATTAQADSAAPAQDKPKKTRARKTSTPNNSVNDGSQETNTTKVARKKATPKK